jgi:hypothetical protein
LCAKAKEAELNARMLSLESQIHWLGEQNTQLQAELVKASNGADNKDRCVEQGKEGVASSPAQKMSATTRSHRTWLHGHMRF